MATQPRAAIRAAVLLCMLALLLPGCGLLAPAAAPAAASTRAPAGGSWNSSRRDTAEVASRPVAPGARATRRTRGGWLHTRGSAIVDRSGRPFHIKGISWFGMEIDTCAPHGLWQVSLDAALDDIADDGFNTLRLPYANDCLRRHRPSSIDYAKNPSLRGKSPLRVLDTVIARARAHGLRVILDRHRPTSSRQSELWYTRRVPEHRWIADWVMLARRYRHNPTVIGFDLHNEPNGRACWGCGNRRRDWAAATTRAGNAVLRANRHLLVIVEGVQVRGDGQYTFWGGALDQVAHHPIDLNVKHRVVYSPHEYPGSIAWMPWFDSAQYPANLPAQWDASWGYIAETGIAPVLLGEFGSTLKSRADRQWMKTIVRYLDTRDIGFAFWAYNPNSGDTGGIVKNDWRTPERRKLKALATLLR